MSVTPILFEKTFPEGIFRVYDGDPQRQELISPKQTHSKIVLNALVPDMALHEGDGIWGEWNELRGQTVAVKTADCLPVLMIGTKGAAIVHAGWRGLAAGIMLDSAIKSLDIKTVFIGPCIHRCCFDVTGEFQAHFPDTPLKAREDGKLCFDLVAEAQRQITQTYPQAVFEDSGICTCCEAGFSSFRRDKTTRRIWNAFRSAT